VIQEIGIVVFNGMERLDLEGPLGVFSWTTRVGGPPVAFRFLSKDGKSVQDHLVRRSIAADDVIEHVPALDLLIVPGGNPAEFVKDQELIRQIKVLMPRSGLVASVCTGAFLVAKTGLANGKRMTTHQTFRGDLEREFSEIQVVKQRYVNDGTLWSSAGISAGIDMSLAMVRTYWDVQTAVKVRNGLEYFPEPPFPPA
jgi:transcriptional regulator GlxA family with amidase domain